jgi:hypothetical protein
LQKSQTGHKNGGGNHGQLTNARKRIQFFAAQMALCTDILGSDPHVVLLLWNCCIHIRLAEARADAIDGDVRASQL